MGEWIISSKLFQERPGFKTTFKIPLQIFVQILDSCDSFQGFLFSHKRELALWRLVSVEIEVFLND